MESTDETARDFASSEDASPTSAPSEAPDFFAGGSGRPRWVRILVMVYFVCSLSFVSLTCCPVLLAVAAYYRTVDAIGWMLKESPDTKAARREREIYNRALPADAAITFAMHMCQWIFRRRYINGVRPCRVMSAEEWALRKKTHTTNRNGLTYVELPKYGNHIALPPGVMVLCNHLSNLDGFCLKTALFPGVSKAIIKRDAIYVPFVGWVIYLGLNPLVQFTSEKGGWGTSNRHEVLERSEEVIRSGHSLLVFPEGVRRRFGRMAPFRHGMIKIAIANEFPLFVSAIHGTDIGWPLHSPLIDFCDIYLNFDNEVLIPSKTDNPEVVASALVDRMLGLLAPIPSYNPESEKPITSMEEYKALEESAGPARRRRQII